MDDDNEMTVEELEEIYQSSSIIWYIIYICLLIVWFSLLTAVLSRSTERLGLLWSFYAISLVLSLVGVILVWKARSVSKWISGFIAALNFVFAYAALLMANPPEDQGTKSLVVFTHIFSIVGFIMHIINLIVY